MNRFYRLIFMIAVVAFFSTQAGAALRPVAAAPAPAEKNVTVKGYENFSVDAFLALTPKQIKEQTGRKLSLKETIALKIAQKQIKKEMRSADAASGPKSQLVALLLVIFVGALGIHRFYLGYTTIGIIQLLTLGGCGIWALIDLIRIITGDLKPADGSEYDPTL